MSDTPRTDKAWKPDGGDGYPTVDVDFSRQLERELNAANEMFRKLNIHALNLTDRIRRLEEDLMDAKNKHAALVADVVLYEDRGERIKRLEEALGCVVVDCNHLHHRKKHQHRSGEPCPVEELIRKAKEAKP